jgi:hypothetical protein
MLFIAFDSQVSDINDPKNNLALDAISERLLTKVRGGGHLRASGRHELRQSFN